VLTTITYDQISSLKYLSHITSEVLHLYPPVGVTLRVVAEDTSLNGALIPKARPSCSPRLLQTGVWHCGAPTRRNLDTSGEALKDEAIAVERNYGFLSFLAGSRGCIGDVFARMEFEYLLAATIRRFEFEQDGRRDVVVKAELTAKPQRGISVSVREVAWVRIFLYFVNIVCY